MAAKKTSAKKPAKKVVKKTAKAAKPKAKVAKKTSAKKNQRFNPPHKKDVLDPVKFAGLGKTRAVDDPGEATEGESIAVKPSVDPDTGVLTMVPVTN